MNWCLAPFGPARSRLRPDGCGSREPDPGRESMLREYARATVAAGVSASECGNRAGGPVHRVCECRDQSCRRQRDAGYARANRATAAGLRPTPTCAKPVSPSEDIRGDGARRVRREMVHPRIFRPRDPLRPAYMESPRPNRRERLIVSVAVFATLEQHTAVEFSTSAMSGGYPSKPSRKF